MKHLATTALILATLPLFAEKQPFERYQTILDRQMFGQPPPGFDDTVSPNNVSASKSEEKVLTADQAQIQSAIHFSVINITPDGATAVGFSDNSVQPPVHYYLKVGESRNGWTVKEADPVKAKMTIEKDGIEVSLDLGAGSAPAKGGAATRRGSLTPAGRPVGGLLAGGFRRNLTGGNAANGGTAPLPGASLRERRAQREQERKAAEAAEAAEKAQREKEREEQREMLQKLKDELAAQRAEREAAEREKAEREAKQENGNAED